ncbi:MAG: PIN domain-containing protein [Rhodocyclaceae bacterium]|nr:PIN domain-containing protein [Rhodocyclaceae bacterium]
MAGHSNYTALLDACVLYPIVTCDALLRLASQGLYAPKWSRRIETEWLSNLLVARPELEGKLEYRRGCMREAVPDWEVSEQAISSLIPSLNLPDEKDRHVLAAAIVGHADCIVTANLKDFPDDVLACFGIEAVHPDTFIISQWDLFQVQTIAAFKTMRAGWRRPEATAEDFAAAFDRGGLPATALRLRDAAELI